ncbi:MAG: hypothetical protein LBJ38_01545 [Oscillospiraceae bacterium]|jgi:hypothetical protein|nr:hypothetical protein [Oscillospiraceae bacterium]
MRNTAKKKLALFLGLFFATTAFCSNARPFSPWLGLRYVLETGDGYTDRWVPAERYIWRQGGSCREPVIEVQQRPGLRQVTLSLVPFWDPNNDVHNRVFFLRAFGPTFRGLQNGVSLRAEPRPGRGLDVVITLPEDPVRTTVFRPAASFSVGWGLEARDETWYPEIRIVAVPRYRPRSW